MRTAAAFELLARDTLLVLILIAARAANGRDQAWPTAADKVTENVESEVSTELERLRSRAARRHRLTASEPRDIHPEFPDAAASEDLEGGGPEEEQGASGAVGVVTEHGRSEQLVIHEDEETDPLSNKGLALRLRQMASVLEELADGVERTDE